MSETPDDAMLPAAPGEVPGASGGGPAAAEQQTAEQQQGPGERAGTSDGSMTPQPVRGSRPEGSSGSPSGSVRDESAGERAMGERESEESTPTESRPPITVTRLFRLLKQMTKYGIFGGLAAGTDFVLYTVLVTYTGLMPLIANVISILAGIALSFTLNSRFTFGRTDHAWARGMRFLTVGLLGLGLSTAMLAGLTHGLQLSPVVAKLITLPLIALFQFVINKFWSFGSLD